MNLLTEPLPHLVDIAGHKFPIVWDFRAGIKLETIMDNPDLPDNEKVTQMLELYYPCKTIQHVPDEWQWLLAHLPEAQDAVLKFYTGWQAPKLPGQEGTDDSDKKRACSFYYDSANIFASFWQQYSIDLTREKLHWWTFSNLLTALNEDTPQGRIIMYRTIDTAGMPKEQKQQYEKMKRQYELPEIVSKAEQERDERLADILAHGGNLNDLG
jgi:hypothetical protein